MTRFPSPLSPSNPLVPLPLHRSPLCPHFRAYSPAYSARHFRAIPAKTFLHARFLFFLNGSRAMAYAANNFLAKLLRVAIVFAVARRPVTGEPGRKTCGKSIKSKLGVIPPGRVITLTRSSWLWATFGALSEQSRLATFALCLLVIRGRITWFIRTRGTLRILFAGRKATPSLFSSQFDPHVLRHENRR